MRTLTSLYRYPIKGLSPEALTSVQLEAGRGFPRDRELAITNGSWEYSPQTYEPRPKRDFLMLMMYESLALLRTHVDEDSGQITIETKGGHVVKARLDDAQSLEVLSDFFIDYMKPTVLNGRPRLVQSHQQRFTDVSVVSPTLMSSISLINLASVRDLADKMGVELDPLRFRANVYFDGGNPWEELDWLDQEITLGGVRARVVMRTRRCAATNVNPGNGLRDLGVPQALMKFFKQPDLGVYVEVLNPGALQPGDSLLPPA